MKEYKKLIVWQKAMQLVKMVYEISSLLPKSEVYGLSSQIKRAAVSVPSNIAEANGRNTDGERKQFYGVAPGSAYELETQLLLLPVLKLITDQQIKQATDLLDEIQKITATLIRNIEAKKS